MGIADETLVLGHNTGALASRLNAPEHNATIQSAVLETTGLELEVRCEVGTNPKAFGFETDSPKPVWNPEQDAGEAGSDGDAQETAAQEAESTNPVAAEQVEPEPAPESTQPEGVVEPAESGHTPKLAKSDVDLGLVQSPEDATEPEATPPSPPTPEPAREVAPEPEPSAPPVPPAPVAPEDTWGEPARLGGAPESAPDMPKSDSAVVPEDASEAGTNPAVSPNQQSSTANPAAESATSIWGQPAQLGGGGGPTHQSAHQPTHQPTYQAQPAQPAHERPAPQAQTQPQPSAKPTTSTWRERARRGNKLLAEQQNAPRFSDGTPAPPEPSEPWDAPPPPPPPADVPEMSAPEPGAEAGFGAGAAPMPGAAPGQPVPPAPKGAPEPSEQRESVVPATPVGPAGPVSPGASAPTTSIASASAASAAPTRASQNAAPAPGSAPDSGSSPGAGTSNDSSHRRPHRQHHQSRQHHRPGDEEAEMMHQAATELGEHDHRDAMTIAISLVEQELGGRVV